MRGKRANGTNHARIRETTTESLNMENLYS